MSTICWRHSLRLLQSPIPMNCFLCCASKQGSIVCKCCLLKQPNSTKERNAPVPPPLPPWAICCPTSNSPVACPLLHSPALAVRSSDVECVVCACSKGHLVALDIIRGLVFLHSNKVVHADLKAKNVLLTQNAGKPQYQLPVSDDICLTLSTRGMLSLLAVLSPVMQPFARSGAARLDSVL